MTGGTWVLSSALRLRARHQPTFSAAPIPFGAGDGVRQSLQFAAGGNGFDLLVLQTRPLAASATETLDLFDGSVLDVYGFAAPFRVLRGYAIWVDSGGDAAGLTVGNAAANPHPLFNGAGTHTRTVFPNGPDDHGGSPAGVVVSSTSRNVKLTNNGAPLFYVIALAGSRHAGGVWTGPLGLTYP